MEYVSAYWYDTEEEIEYMISLSMDDVMNEFETEESYEMDFNDLVDELFGIRLLLCGGDGLLA